MPGRIIADRGSVTFSRHRLGSRASRSPGPPNPEVGLGLLEFLIALLIFSSGMLGLLSAQLAGGRVGHEARQQSIALALARDAIERVRVNPIQATAYLVQNLGDPSMPQSTPGRDCLQQGCTALQLAAFDLWQWELLLQGTQKNGGNSAGGLAAPRACITAVNGVFTVAISWLNLAPGLEAQDSVCGSDLPVAEAIYENEENSARGRRQLTLSTYIAGS